jgi:hypothetical protein
VKLIFVVNLKIIYYRSVVLTLYSSTAGMFKLPIFSPWTALAASSQVHCAGDTNCSHQTNLSVGPLRFLNLVCLPTWSSSVSVSSQSSQPCRYFEGLLRGPALAALNTGDHFHQVSPYRRHSHIQIVVFLVVSLRNTDGTIIQGANSISTNCPPKTTLN